MRLGQGVEWALHCCSVLAAVPPGRALPAARLAEYHELPAAYLAKQLQALSQAGLVESVPGPRGGYRLARPASAITVLDVVLAVEGDEAAFACTEIRQRGPSACAPSAYTAPCGIARVMWAAEDAWRESLRAHTVADLLEMAVREAPAQQLRVGGRWIEEVIR
ncbi:MAG TPA: Rrf2 family transcriptional regulator [Acidimicrobiales bacterium]|nr:Rrf2 family transcriptional regulator [Acidimicrobiales bacterium]